MAGSGPSSAASLLVIANPSYRFFDFFLGVILTPFLEVDTVTFLVAMMPTADHPSLA
jgi:hypothetical protein